MEIKTYIKNLKISPRKLRFLLAAVKKMPPAKSLNYLFYLPNKSAKLLYKSIKSAVDNAKNTLKVSEDLLKFKLLTVEEGNKIKRFQPGGRGTAKTYFHRYAHIKMILEADDSGLKKKPEPKTDKKLKVKVQKSRVK